ncbi:MAG: ATP-grasp domain-containing protein [Bacteroidales bacterium]|nr:ATP-grasp domain-containing protein [Bacteroidales bacterium]
MNIKGKKLLILGGTKLSCDIITTAEKMGVYTIVTDWNDVQKSPAKRYADEYWDVSLMDYKELLKRVHDNNVDGILTGFTDSYLLPYQKLCELAKKPCYATKGQLEWTLDKKKFKEKCRKHNVPVVPEYNMDNFDKSIISRGHKVIIKPVDNSGSRGICICEDPESFEEKLKYSLDFSAKKKVVVERYMDCDDVSFEYKVQEGEVSLTAICDRYIYKTLDEGSVTSTLIYPSKYTEAYLSDVDKRVKRMFELEGLRNGVLFMQAFVDDGEFYFYEMGYRLSGGRHYIFTENQNGDNAVKELINFALTGKMSNYRIANIANPSFKDVCSQQSIICKSDKIAKVEGWDDISGIPQVIDAMQVYKEGDVVGKEGTTASIFARLHIVVKSLDELNTIKRKIYSTLKVENEDGENLVIFC